MYITPEFILDLESNLTQVHEDSYSRVAADLWYQHISSYRTSKAQREVLHWLLETAQITELEEGEMVFDDLMSHQFEYEHGFAGRGTKVKRRQFEDTDGNGVDLLAQWARQMGALQAYWPQEQIANMIKANTAKCYDGVALFSQAHHLNPAKGVSGGLYANDFTGAAAGSYPGALPIDASVSEATALANLYKGVQYIGGLKTPNGKYPRRLKVKGILHPPALTQRLATLTEAETIVKVAGSVGGAADVKAEIRRLGLAQPIEAVELGAAYGGSDTDYYYIVEGVAEGPIGSLVYSQREAFGMTMYGPMNDAQLARIEEFEWMLKGRNAVTTGHPYGLFRGRTS